MSSFFIYKKFKFYFLINTQMVKATTKRELVENAVNKVNDIENVARLAAIVETIDWKKIEMEFSPRISKNYPTKKEKIIKECMSMIRNRPYDENEPSIFQTNFDLKNIKSFKLTKIRYKA